MNRKRLAPHGATCAAVLSLAAVAATDAAVEDGFPDQSTHVVASATSAAATAFDSFVSATGVSSASLSNFHSFVSQTETASPALTRFNSEEPAGFVIVIR